MFCNHSTFASMDPWKLHGSRFWSNLPDSSWGPQSRRKFFLVSWRACGSRLACQRTIFALGSGSVASCHVTSPKSLIVYASAELYDRLAPETAGSATAEEQTSTSTQQPRRLRKIANWMSKNCQKLATLKKLPKIVFFSNCHCQFFFKDNFWQLFWKKCFWQYFDIHLTIFWRVRCVCDSKPQYKKTFWNFQRSPHIRGWKCNRGCDI